MHLTVFEDSAVAQLAPLCLTRPAFDLRVGATSLLQWQRRHFQGLSVGLFIRPALVNVCRTLHPDMSINTREGLTADTSVFVNARWFPPTESCSDFSTPRVGVVNQQIAYVVAPPKAPLAGGIDAWPRWLEELQAKLPQVPAGGWMVDYPWNLVELNDKALWEEPRYITEHSPIPSIVNLLGPSDRLFIDSSAQIEPFVVIDTRKGPVIVDRRAWIKSFSRLEGPCYIGPQTWVMAAHVAGSAIGPVCRIGGEVEEAIVHGYSNKAHEGFLGHSYVGEWVNLAAGTQVSDLRNDYRTILMTVAGSKLDTGLTKVGSFIGDHTKTGINTLLNSGTSVGAFCQVYPSNLLPPRVIPSYCSFARGQLTAEENLSALFTTAATAMRRRNFELTQELRTLYESIHAASRTDREAAVGRSQKP